MRSFSCSWRFGKLDRFVLAFAATLGLLVTRHASAQTPTNPAGAIVLSEFVFQDVPFPACHASTIVETKEGFLASWFGGSREGKPDVGIWLSRRDRQGWTPPVEVANGKDIKKNVRYPCWNPVLFQPSAGPLLLFYKVGPSPSSWWGMMMTSEDQGKTWTPPKRLPPSIVGPVRAKPIELANGVILCGASTEFTGWQVHMERGLNFAKSWQALPPVNGPMEFGAIQPTILNWGDRGIQILCRSKQLSITESWSRNGGATWTKMSKTELPNPNSGIDAVMLHDGRALLVYNHSDADRSSLHVAISENAKDWAAAEVLENQEGEFSYPAVIQSSDGLIHVTYTWRREKIKHVVLDATKFAPRPIRGGLWP